MGLLIIINLIKGADYFSISIINGALYGNIPNILYAASELVILSIGMTFVTAATGGQDISVGVAAAITSAVFGHIIFYASTVTLWTVLWGLLVSCGVGLLIGAFNGSLVAFFKVQPMVATLILFTGGRSIAFLIDEKKSPVVGTDLTGQIGGVIPGVPIQTPIILTAVFIGIVALLLKFTNLKLYAQSVGINERAARLNGIDPVKVKFLTFMIMGICTAVAGFINLTKTGRHDSMNLLRLSELDAILAVAIGGNLLSGGKFSIAGSIIGAYTIEMLTRTLLRLEVDTVAIKAFKAGFIIILMVVSSPVVREAARKLANRLRKGTAKGPPGQEPPAEVEELAIPGSDPSPRQEA
jgi:ribose/xylose/arabinose/galactoside ABC-type transport system permease subunit